MLVSNFTPTANDRDAEWGLKPKRTPRAHELQKLLSLFVVRSSIAEWLSTWVLEPESLCSDPSSLAY